MHGVSGQRKRILKIKLWSEKKFEEANPERDRGAGFGNKKSPLLRGDCVGVS